MQLASMTSMFFTQRGTAEKIPLQDSLHRHKELGYSALDLNMCAVGRFESELNGEDWKERAAALREEADRIGTKIVQSHLPYRTAAHRTAEDIETLNRLSLRALEISAICGVKWAVIHPLHDPAFPAEAAEEQIRYNTEAYRDLIALAKEKGVGLAFENCADSDKVRRFASTATELAAFVDSLDSPLMGACWDFGHANLTYGDTQTWAIRKMGSRIKALHFADNFGLRDDHVAPFLGKIKWEEIMKVLKEIGYNGPLVVEVMQNNTMPDALKNSSMNFLTDICRYLMKLYEEA